MRRNQKNGSAQGDEEADEYEKADDSFALKVISKSH
jgi:hypothetical protein